MSNFAFETEKYVVHYVKFGFSAKKRAFDELDDAVEFAKEKMNEGFVLSLKQINLIVGWY